MISRQPKRASGLKALEAITSNKGKQKSENEGVARQKRMCSPSSKLPQQKKRNALARVDVNNPSVQPKGVVKVGKPVRKPQGSQPEPATVVLEPQQENVDPTSELEARPPLTRKESVSDSAPPHSGAEDTPVTVVKNVLEAASLSDDSKGASLSSSQPQPCATVTDWKDIDEAESSDPSFSSQYAPDIYRYMRQREEYFCTPAYMPQQKDINSSMRTILVDWLIEVQENFELFHETLYLAVRLTDRYLSRKEVKREYLQLVGATCMLIAAKFEELCPPLVDDFLYLCDDAYTHQEMLTMERDILHALDYDINMPVAYRFLRRLARAAEADMEIHTLARYISESTLQEYSFVTEDPSRVAAAAMYLALRMKKLGPWTPTLVHYSGYSVKELLPMVERLNGLVREAQSQATAEQAGQKTTTCTVRSKYSHKVFFEVALVPCLENVEADALEGSRHSNLLSRQD